MTKRCLSFKTVTNHCWKNYFKFKFSEVLWWDNAIIFHGYNNTLKYAAKVRETNSGLTFFGDHLLSLLLLPVGLLLMDGWCWRSSCEDSLEFNVSVLMRRAHTECFFKLFNKVTPVDSKVVTTSPRRLINMLRRVKMLAVDCNCF